MKKPSQLLDDILDTLESLQNKIDSSQFTTPAILEALTSFADSGLDDLIRDLEDAREAAESTEEELEEAEERIEELEEN